MLILLAVILLFFALYGGIAISPLLFLVIIVAIVCLAFNHTRL